MYYMYTVKCHNLCLRCTCRGMEGSPSWALRVCGWTLLKSKYDNSNRDTQNINNQFSILVITNICTGSMIYLASRRRTFPSIRGLVSLYSSWLKTWREMKKKISLPIPIPQRYGHRCKFRLWLTVPLWNLINHSNIWYFPKTQKHKICTN